MAVTVGTYIWLACEVKPGPFPNERLVRLRSTFGEWLGFVPESSLKDPIPEGKTFIHVLVLDREDHRIRAQVPGVSVGQSVFEDFEDRLPATV